MSLVGLKIVKQLEYYFGDINLSKDKHLKSLIEAAEDGWVSFEEMLKFPRLKILSDNVDIIKTAIQESGSKLIESNENGIRRNTELQMPTDLQEVTDIHVFKCLYVKGFKSDVSIDEIIEFLEKFGGPTLNVYMRRIPRSKAFKGSIFAIFNEKADAEKFLLSEEASKFNGNDIIRMWQSDYLAMKKAEFDEKQKEKEFRVQAASATKEALLDTKMTKGALIELSGFDTVEAQSENTEEKIGDFTENRDTRTATKNLKTWLTDLLVDVAPVSWVEYFHLTGKVIVRFGKENAAEEVLKKLNEIEGGVIKYQIYTLKASSLSGEAEKDYWRNILNEQSKKQKRPTGRGGRFGGPDRKRMRR